jgi:hypothetical protein
MRTLTADLANQNERKNRNKDALASLLFEPAGVIRKEPKAMSKVWENFLNSD